MWPECLQSNPRMQPWLKRVDRGRAKAWSSPKDSSLSPESTQWRRGCPSSRGSASFEATWQCSSASYEWHPARLSKKSIHGTSYHRRKSRVWHIVIIHIPKLILEFCRLPEVHELVQIVSSLISWQLSTSWIDIFTKNPQHNQHDLTGTHGEGLHWLDHACYNPHIMAQLSCPFHNVMEWVI